jgi:nucleoside-diphosphate-sugar epimerase
MALPAFDLRRPGTFLVTGASGFIGGRLVHELARRGHTVRALCRQPRLATPAWLVSEGRRDADGGQIKLVRGDLGDRDSLERATAGCDGVFHVAGYAKNWAPRRDHYFDINVRGLEHVLETARRQGVGRVVWTSTMMTLGPTPPGAVGDEDTPRTPPRFFTAYEESKAEAERVASRHASEGLDVVTVNPTRVYGPGRLTEGNSVTLLIDQYDRGRAPILLNRGRNVANYVLVDDVVEGHLLAMARGRTGERYLLGGENVSLADLLALIDRISGRRHVRIPINGSMALSYATVHLARAKWFGVHPHVTPPWVRVFLADWAFRSDKATRELGYTPRSLEDGLRITYRWLERIRREQP